MKGWATIGLGLLGCLLTLGAGFAAGVSYARRQGGGAEALATVYVYGRAVDASGGLVAGVRVELGTQASTTNASGQWGLSGNLTAGQVINLYVFPEFESVELPAGVKGQAPAGNVVTFTVPSPVPAQLGPFVVHMPAVATLTPTFSSTPTRTPTPTEWIVTQTPTWTPRVTETPQSPPGTPTPYPTRPTPWWLEGLKPGEPELPIYVDMGLETDYIAAFDWDWDNCFNKKAAVYNLGQPLGPVNEGIYCNESQCRHVLWQLWPGAVMLWAYKDDPCFVGIKYAPDNGDGRWLPKGTVTP